MARPDPDPDKLLLELGIDHPRELDIEAIAQYCGATVLFEELEGCEARLTAGGDRAIITVQRTTHPHRSRFSAAHELAHWMLDRHRRCFACTGAMIGDGWREVHRRKRGDAFEKRANRWAADLLMPERLFVPAIRDQPQTLNTARNLTRTFSTSLFATSLRLVRFGTFDSMLILSRPGDRWKWFYRSPYMPAAAWPLPQPGPQSIAYHLLRGDRSYDPELVRWDQWLDLSSLDDPPTFYLREDSMLMRNGEVLSLLWFDDTTVLDYFQNEQPPHRRNWVGDRG